MTPPAAGPLRVCVYHRTMGSVIAARMAQAHPEIQLEVAEDTTVDPPRADEIHVLVANTFPRGLLHRCRQLRWLHLTGTGTEHVSAEKPPPSLLITTSARVPAVAVAEFAWMGLLALAKDAVRLVDQQRARQWRLPDAHLVAGSRLLLLGLGRIGVEIARRAPAFGVAVTAVTRSARPSPWARTLPPDRLAEAAEEADHLVLAAPDTPATRGLVGAAVLDRLPSHACVVNVGRSRVLDTAELVRRLRSGRLRAALLDVHDTEPLPDDDPIWQVPNLWITPHGAYRFPQEEQRVADVLLDNLSDLLGDRPLRDRAHLGGVHRPRAEVATAAAPTEGR